MQDSSKNVSQDASQDATQKGLGEEGFILC